MAAHGTASLCAALRAKEPCRVMTDHNKRLKFQNLVGYLVGVTYTSIDERKPDWTFGTCFNLEEMNKNQ